MKNSQWIKRKYTLFKEDSVKVIKMEKGHRSNTKKIIQILLEMLFIFLCTYGSLCGFISAFHLLVGINTIKYMLFVLSIACVIGIYPAKSRKFVVGGYILLLGICFFAVNQIALDGAKLVYNQVIQYMNEYFDINILEVLVNSDSETKKMTVFFMLLAAAEIFVVSFVVCCKKSRILYVDATLPFVALPYLAGLCISPQYLLAYGLTTMVVLIRPAKKNQLATQQIQGFMFLAGTVFLILCFTFVKKEYFYEDFNAVNKQVKWQKDIKKLSEQDTWNEILKTDFLNKNTARGGLNGGKLGRNSEIKFENKTQFIITMEQTEEFSKLYLRGFVGEKYSKNSWKVLSKEEKKNLEIIEDAYEVYSENISAKFIRSMSSEDYMVLRSVSQFSSLRKIKEVEIDKKAIENKQYLMPYGTKDTIFMKDTGFLSIRENKNNYQLFFYPVFNEFQKILTQNIGLTEEEANIFFYSSSEDKQTYNTQNEQMEKEYRDFVYFNYLDAPDNVDALVEANSNLKNMEIDYYDNNHYLSNLGAIIQTIRDNMYSTCSYTLSPGRLPANKDFVEYFLKESKKGYCTHFASAAALLLRKSGIPSRYVEGYVVTESAYRTGKVNNFMKTINVKDNAAHAWVEIYINGIGWVPVEFTPSSGEGTVSANQITSTWKPGNVQPTVQPVFSPRNTPSSRQTSTPKASGKKGTTGKGTQAEDRNYVNIIFLAILVVVAVIVGALLLHYIYLKKRAKKLLGTTNRNKKVIFLYQQLCFQICTLGQYSFSRIQSGDWFEAIEVLGIIEKEELSFLFEIMDRAAFGPGWIPEQEMVHVEHLYVKVRTNLYENATKMQRLYYLFWKVY
ncbi:transglutaminase-like domain-containing protein [Anaeromicropila populeti]|uniref:Transglutaminase-like superfamily protein n=1 Tax=Anaeromicropila populeti TaxID=37658 RepID=A0A1I6LC86_9FIRM|nr:transglutaminase-like domain-containing protein [Anaeromicropila populeti]SFS00878.1 Transglutaminase-like superfamily protein [Anaeromicropila populeti]